MQQPEDDELLTVEEVAEITKVPVATVYRWNHTGTGPTARRVGRHVRYWKSEVWTWVNNQAVSGPAA